MNQKILQKDGDKNKRLSSASSNHRDKYSNNDHSKDKNSKLEPSMGSSAANSASQKPSQITKSVSSSSLPAQQAPPPPLVVPKPHSPTPPEDPTLPTKYLDITQFKAPEDEEEEHRGEEAASNPNPDMNELTAMLQQGMSVEEVAESLNITLDEQTHSLLTTLKKQLDLATAIAKQSMNQGFAVPDQSGVGKTYDYSNASYSDDSANKPSGDSSGVQIALNQMLSQQQGQNFVDYNTQDPSYSQARGPADSVYSSETGADLTNTDKGEGYSSFRPDSVGRVDMKDSSSFGDHSISGGVNSDFKQYGSDDLRAGSVQKQYSYGDTDGAQGPGLHRNSSTSSFPGNAAGPPGMLSSPPYRNAGDGGVAANVVYRRTSSEDGKFTRGHGLYGNKPQGYNTAPQFGRGGQGGPRPLMSYDVAGRGRGNHRGGFREKW